MLLLGFRFRSYHTPEPGTAGELGCCAMLAAYAAAGGAVPVVLQAGTAGESGGAMLAAYLYVSFGDARRGQAPCLIACIAAQPRVACWLVCVTLDSL